MMWEFGPWWEPVSNKSIQENTDTMWNFLEETYTMWNWWTSLRPKTIKNKTKKKLAIWNVIKIDKER